MITENPEISVEVKNNALAYQNSLLNQLGVNKSQEQFALTKDAYRGTRVFSWNKPYDAYLPSYFLFPAGQSQLKEFVHTASLVRYQDCLQMGSVWNFTQNVAPFAITNSTESLETIANRKFVDLSPVKINSFYDFRTQDRISNILDIFLGEKLAQKGILNITNLSRIVCKGNYSVNLKSPTQTSYPARAHRLVNVQMFSELAQKKITWPNVTFKSWLDSGVFAEKNKDFFDEKTPTPFHPEKTADQIVNKLLPELHDLKNEEFKIIRRYRGWVYINRGRAFGLQMGMRLIGPAESRLHIIRLLPEVNGEIDSSIAFIRYEDEKRPLVVGDILKLDPTLFPKSRNSDNKMSK
ncbi:hypothetical protein AXG55_06155 [Silvanigrella aquatica]|uniref:Uncharacterized protein n=2 Tax=Silvanigrella aquatica TaxID=1915309 RepID=A0A1L4D001_9BACT|nr:hypothetical protein AXG55_06155 [Silvanigrella aquatica]